MDDLSGLVFTTNVPNKQSNGPSAQGSAAGKSGLAPMNSMAQTPRSMAPMNTANLQSQPAGQKKNEDAFASLNIFGSVPQQQQPDLSKLSLAEQQRLKLQQSTPTNFTPSAQNVGIKPPAQMSSSVLPMNPSGSPLKPLMDPLPSTGNKIVMQPSRSNTTSPQDAFSDLLGNFGASAPKSQQPLMSMSSAQSSPSKTAVPMNQLSSSASNPVTSAPAQLDAWNFDLLASKSQPAQAVTVVSSVQSASVVAHDDDPFGLFSDKPKVSAKFSTTTVSAPPSASVQQSVPAQKVPAVDTPVKIAENIALPQQPNASPSQQSASQAPQITSQQQKQQQPPSTSSVGNEQVQLDSLVSRMVELGFTAGESREALHKNGNNLNKAVEYLFNRPSGGTGGSKDKTADQISAQLSKIGLSQESAEKASKLLSNAGKMGMNLFNRAKNMVQDKTKKLAPKSRNDGFDDSGYYNADDNDEGQFERFGINGGRNDGGQWGNSSGHSSAEDLPGVANNTFSQPSIPKPVAAAPVRPAAPPKKQRQTPKVQCSAEQVQASERSKEVGNEFFKKGQYGDAEENYSRAIDCLPVGHLLLIPLLNNRAAARLKTGHYKECQQDCTQVEQMCLQEIEYSDVTAEQVQEYRDALSKALLRRATALENMEKYQDALKDYRGSLDYNPNAKGAQEGIRRCQRAKTTPMDDSRPNVLSNVTNGINMTAAVQSSPLDDLRSLGLAPPSSTPSAAPKPQPAAAPAASALEDLFGAPHPKKEEFQSVRVEALREKERQKEQEEAEKLNVKDSVDARLMIWKKGKETNVRALISSLETVLWDDLRADWKPVNLSELITPNQVKIRYMKAIGKLHPDKLSNMTLTAEQKLMANGIFSSLNDAWDAFKVQNNLN